jgi:proline iminopeptidase
MRAAAKAWSIWEGRTSKLVQDPWESIQERFGEDNFSLAFARIENHYFTHQAFFPRDGWLIEKNNIDKIRHIPTVIVQGRYDVVCPPISAFDLKAAFPEADLRYTLAGHSGFEKENIRELVAAADKFRGVSYSRL